MPIRIDAEFVGIAVTHHMQRQPIVSFALLNLRFSLAQQNLDTGSGKSPGVRFSHAIV